MIIETRSVWVWRSYTSYVGRVGRGAVASHCVLLCKTPLSKTAQIRLQVLRDSNDGFVDCTERSGDSRPWRIVRVHVRRGMLNLKWRDLLRDQAMIPEVQRLARHIHERYPQRAKALIERWMPETERYSECVKAAVRRPPLHRLTGKNRQHQIQLNHQRIDDIDKRTHRPSARPGTPWCDGPKRSVIACMLAIAVGVAPRPKPQ